MLMPTLSGPHSNASGWGDDCRFQADPARCPTAVAVAVLDRESEGRSTCSGLAAGDDVLAEMR